MEAGIFILAIFAAIIIRIIAGSFDDDRIERHIRANGGKLISKEWAPFGKGWAGEKNDRIYVVFYLDSAENKHRAYVKTSSFSGVYFTEDVIIEHAQQKKERIPFQTTNEYDLVAENQRLKRELEELKRRK